MSKDAVIKARGEEFEAALCMERARIAVEQMGKLLEGARKEYTEAGDALRAIRSTNAALEADIVAQVVKRGAVALDAEGKSDAALMRDIASKEMNP